MKRLRFGELLFAWDASALPLDPIAPVLPLAFDGGATTDDSALEGAPDLTIQCVPVAAPGENPESYGATPLLYHVHTRCYVSDQGLVLWDGASTLRILDQGRRIEAEVHATSLERAFTFSTATVMMTLLLALRHHGYFHLHACAAEHPDGSLWVVPAESGSGKTTLALAMFAAGARWLSDDALLLRARGDAIEIVGWARMLRLTAQTAQAFPAFEPLLRACPPDSSRKYELDPRVAFADHGLRATTATPTLLLPHIAGRPQSDATRITRAEAFGEILHACAWVTCEQIPERQAQLDLLARWVDRAPAYEIGVGQRVLTDPVATIAELRALLR